jgi:thiosulfate dehydrogenase
MRFPRFPIFFSICAFALLLTATTFAAESLPNQDDVIQGAQLYDKWYAVLGVNPPAENMPIWSRQSTNTRSGSDTWRCNECHGWDYRGAQGEYKTGSHYTGFPDLYALVPELEIEAIVDHLNGEIDPAHDFSPYLDETKITQLAYFLKNGLIDDAEYIDPVSLRVLDPDISHGQELYSSICLSCHGEDGKEIIFQIEGINEYLGSVANRDPWRFLHRTRFGVAGTDMPVGMSLGWTAEDGRDVLAYAQTLPTGGVIVSQPTQNPLSTPASPIGGPASNIWTGILTSLGTLVGMLVVAGLFIGGFLVLALIVVIIFRRRGKRNP